MGSLSNWREAILFAENEKLMEKRILVGLSTGEYIRQADFIPGFMGLTRPEETLTITAHGQSPARSRNMIVEKALENNCTHVLFLDDDMIFPADTLVKLASHDKDIVTALYLLRGFPHYPALFDQAYDSGMCKFTFLNHQEQTLVPAVNCGLGCVLISVEVFKKLEQPWVRLGELEKDSWCDDVGFFNRCREAGFEIWCDLNAIVGHMANIIIWPERFEGTWYTNYRHANGNVRLPQHIPTSQQLEDEVKENKLTLVEST